VRLEVHREKRRLARDVDLAQLGVELERVEREDLAVEPEQVLEMQIAVALAITAERDAALDQRLDRPGALVGPLAQRVDLAEPAPAFERAEVEERELDGLLDLVRVRARQEHPGDVRLGDADARDVVVVSGRTLERRDERRLARALRPRGSLARRHRSLIRA